MAKKPKVLVVDDQPTIFTNLNYRYDGQAVFLSASTEEEARRLFADNPDIELIIMDACLDGPKPDTIGLVQYFRREGFEGLIIAVSSDSRYLEGLQEAGCNVGLYKRSPSFWNELPEAMGIV